MDVIVQLSSDVARVLQEHSPPSGDARGIVTAMQDIGVSLQPLHPSSGDANLDTYFWARVSDEATAQRVIGALRGYKSVKAAYLKPPEGPP